MAWTTPLTAVANTALNASQWNASVRDNLIMTAPNLATAPTGADGDMGHWFTASAANVINQRVIAKHTVPASETLGTASSYLSLTTNGPILSTMTTGVAALVTVTASIANSAATDNFACAEVTGATTMVAADARALRSRSLAGAGNLHRASVTNLLTLTAGSNTFRILYKVAAITGTFVDRNLIVMAL